MTADTITTDRLEGLEALLSASCQTIRRLRLQSLNSDISTEDAAEIVTDVAETINRFCEP